MAFNASVIDGMDTTSTEGTAAKYTIVQYMYPNSMATGGLMGNGGFYIDPTNIAGDKDAAVAALKAAGWVDGTAVFERPARGGEAASVKKIGVLYSDVLTFSLINRRRRWCSKDAGGNDVYGAWVNGAFDRMVSMYGSATSQEHYMIVLKGLEELGPMVLTARSSLAIAFSHKDNGIFAGFHSSVIAKAKLVTGKPWPMRAFWLTVSPEKDNAGALVWNSVGGKGKSRLLVFPSAKFPAVADVDLDVYAVDGEIVQKVIEPAYVDSVDWVKEWADGGKSPERRHEEVAVEAVEELPF